MNRKLAIVAAIVATLLGVIVLAVMLGPRMVQAEIEERLKQKLSARGVHAQWSKFEAPGGSSFVISDVKVHAPKYGLAFGSKRVQVGVSWDSIYSGEVTLTEISIEPAHVTIDIAALGGATDDRAPTEPHPEQRGESTMERILRTMLENPPDVDVTNAKIEVVRGEEKLFRVSAPSVLVEESWGDFEVDFDGEVQLMSERLPEIARAPIPWHFKGELVPSDSSFEYSITAPGDEDAPLVHIDIPELLTILVGNVWGKGTIESRTGGLNFTNVQLIVGPGDVAALHAKAPRIALQRQPNGRPRVEVEEPSIYVAPGRRRVIGKALRELRGSSNDDSAPADSSPGGPGLFTRLASFAGRIDFQLDRLAMGVHLLDDAGDLRTVTLLDRLDTTVVDGRVAVKGKTAGGTVIAEAAVLAGQVWPDYLIVRVEDLHLEKIPGLSTGRTSLPSRGTSGYVSGIVNMNLALTMPSQGMDGPLGQSAGVGEFAVDLEGGRFDLTGVADEPIEDIDAAAAFTLTFEPQLGLITLVEGFVGVEDLAVTATGRVEDFPFDPTVIVNWEMPETECQAFVDAIPDALLGPYAAVEIEGLIQPKGWLKWPIYRPKGMRSRFEDYEDMCETVSLGAEKDAWPAIEVVSKAPTGPHKAVTEIPKRPKHKHDDVYWLNRPFKKRIVDHISDPEEVEIYVGPGTVDYVPLEQLPKYVGGIMYLSEQIDFYVDGPLSESLIKKALRLNLRKGRFVYGGSTVTQQLVKNLFLSRDKSLARKIQEAFISWRVDDAISKDRVLELYLNCIEFGPDVYGIGPAAQHYFQKDARNLTPTEAVFLAMLKPSPSFGPQIVRRGRTPSGAYWTDRVDELFDRLIEHEYLTKAEKKAEKPFVLKWKDGVYEDPNPSVFDIPLLNWGN